MFLLYINCEMLYFQIQNFTFFQKKPSAIFSCVHICSYINNYFILYTVYIQVSFTILNLMKKQLVKHFQGKNY